MGELAGEGADDRSTLPWAFLAALVMVALNLRSAFVAVGPISDELRGDLGVGSASIGLLTSLPVLCFGLLAPLALVVVRRTGAELAMTGCLAAVVVGCGIRSTGPYALAVVGTLVLGAGITVGNIVVPVLIRRESPARAGLVTGIYVSAMNVGSMLATVATVPLGGLGGWRTALGSWGALALGGLLAWSAFTRLRRRTPPVVEAAAPVDAGPERPMWRVPLAWMLGLAFAGQATSYYALTAWLPSLLADEVGLGEGAAGVASSVFQICAILGALGVPLLAARTSGTVSIAVVGVLWMAFPVQLLLAPHAYLVGSVVGGMAQGAGLSVLFTVIVQVTRSDRDSARLSAFVQAVGYAVAALGPTVLGLAHDATAAWTLPVLIVVGSTAAFTVLGVAAGVSQARRGVLT